MQGLGSRCDRRPRSVDVIQQQYRACQSLLQQAGVGAEGSLQVLLAFLGRKVKLGDRFPITAEPINQTGEASDAAESRSIRSRLGCQRWLTRHRLTISPGVLPGGGAHDISRHRSPASTHPYNHPKQIQGNPWERIGVVGVGTVATAAGNLHRRLERSIAGIADSALPALNGSVVPMASEFVSSKTMPIDTCHRSPKYAQI
jgi:hypothetical protein